MVLVTDGYSKLQSNPLENLDLHTILIGELKNDFEESHREYATKQIAILVSWSKSFHKIFAKDSVALFSPRREDIESILNYVVEALKDPGKHSANPSYFKNLYKTASRLLSLYQKREKDNSTTEELQEKLMELKKLFGRSQRSDKQADSLQHANMPKPSELETKDAKPSKPGKPDENITEPLHGSGGGYTADHNLSVIKYLIYAAKRCYYAANYYISRLKNYTVVPLSQTAYLSTEYLGLI